MLGLIFRLLIRILSNHSFTTLRVWRNFDGDGETGAGGRASLVNATDTAPTLSAIRAAATPIFRAWAQTLGLTRELTDQTLWVEDASGGLSTLASGAAVLDAQGAAIARTPLTMRMFDVRSFPLQPRPIARIARVVVPSLRHHVTQRGTGRPPLPAGPERPTFPWNWRE